MIFKSKSVAFTVSLNVSVANAWIDAPTKSESAPVSNGAWKLI